MQRIPRDDVWISQISPGKEAHACPGGCRRQLAKLAEEFALEICWPKVGGVYPVLLKRGPRLSDSGERSEPDLQVGTADHTVSAPRDESGCKPSTGMDDRRKHLGLKLCSPASQCPSI